MGVDRACRGVDVESLAVTILGSKMTATNRRRRFASLKSDSQHTLGFSEDRSIWQRDFGDVFQR